MENIQHHPLVIVGAGPAGLSAAIYAARAELKPVVVTGMTLYGQVSLTNTIENYPGFPDGIGGPELGELFEKQAKRYGAELVYNVVQSIDVSSRPFTVKLLETTLTSDALILTMGADPNKLQIPGEDRLVGRGVSYCATCDGWFFKDKNIHVVGGGDSALEEALFLTRFASSVTIIHRRDQLRAGILLENRARKHPKIHFMWNTVVREIRGDEATHSLLVENVQSGIQEEIPSDGIFIFIGHHPNTAILGEEFKLTAQGTLEVDDHLQTNVPGVFAAGDVADPLYRQVVTSAGMGAAAAISATTYLESLEE